MKKLYLFMTALFVAIAANAATYTAVVKYGSGSWGETSLPMAADGDNYSCVFDKKESFNLQIRVVDGSSTTYYKTGDTSNSPIGEHETSSCNKDQFSWNSVTEGSTTVYKIAFNPTNKKVIITEYTQGEDPQPTGIVKYAIYGTMFGDDGWTGYDFENKNGKWVLEDKAITSNSQFGIQGLDKDSKQVQWIYGENNNNEFSGVCTLNTVIEIKDSGNGTNWKYTGSATTKYDIVFDPDNNTLTISNHQISYPDMVLVGGSNSWNTSDEANKATSTDGTYTWTFSKLEAQDFKVALFGKELNTANTWGAGATLTVNGSAQTMYNGGGNCVIAKDVENATVTFNKNDLNIKVTGTEVDDPTPTTYDIRLKGSSTGLNWKEGTKPTSVEGNVYTWTLPTLDGDFKFSIGDDWYRYVGSDEINTNTDYALTKSSTTSNNKVSKTVTDATITVTFDGATPKTLRVIEKSVACTVYFNAGADWFNLETMNQGRGAATTGDAGKMQARLIKQDGTLEAAKDMTNMMAAGETELPIFSIDVENPRNYKGIQFQCKGANDLTWTYNSVKSADASDYKEAEWERYIYGPGSKKSESVNDCAAEQSYITFDEYVEIRDHEKETIYVIGGGFNSFNYTTNEAGQQVFDLTSKKDYKDWGYGDDGIATASKDDGVYLFPVTFKDDVEDITFKMSWINAEEFRLKVGAAATGDYDSGRDNRWWATFNLGIVGPTFAPKYINADGTTNVQQALKDEVIKLDDNGINYNVQYFANRARKISRYNQYNWWIKKGTLSLDATAARWVVIDTESLTSALVPFRPAPNLSEVTASEASIYDGDISGYSEALGSKLEGSATSGAARITQTNTATGTATITVSSGISLFDYDYRVEYHLYDGDNLITKFDGKKDAAKYEIKLNNMVASDGAKISVRCFYYDGVNNTYFRSRTQYAEIEAGDGTYNAPVAGVTSAKLFLDGNGWNAHVTIPFSIKKFKYKESESVEKELVVYPDYSLDVTGDKCENIRLASKDDWHVKAGIGSANHTAWNEEGEYLASEHNWAALSLKSEDETNNNYEFQFVLEGIAPASTSIEDLADRFEWKLNLKAAYPFLLDTQSAPTVVAYDKNNNVIADTPASVRRKAAGDSENSRYNISMSDMPSEVIVNATKASDLSGVNDVEVAEDGEAELYNLQGIRVVGEPAPGIYLRRNGSKVEKVMIH